MQGSGRLRAVAVIAGMALVGALATGCGGRDRGSGRADEHATTVTYTSSGELPERLAADGTTIVVGAPQAATTVHLYEDPRCPVCRDFEEDGGGRALRKITVSGQIRTEYTLASFLDGRLGGKGSRRAANALRAALDEGRFLEYHDALYAHQPPEETDGYTDAFLLRIASRVHGLRGPDFDAAVRDMKYADFVTASQRAYTHDHATGTPTFAVNGVLVEEPVRSQFFKGDALQLAISEAAAEAPVADS
ncbi:thioredoxin domain-containing protein [Streptomyces sp. NPDC046915]|uniref:DsbA family protein n=1 Tax=Streptomyces sp. NPDC046915 TaxID=3155257 RepID=UPI0033D55136